MPLLLAKCCRCFVQWKRKTQIKAAYRRVFIAAVFAGSLCKKGFCLFKNNFIKFKYFVCRIFGGPGRHWPHTTAGWGDDPQCVLWHPQVRPSVSVGPPFRAGPRHPDLSRRGTHTAPHRSPRPPAEDTALLCLHQMWQGVLGRLSLRPCPFHVSGRLSHNRHWLSCSPCSSCSAWLTKRGAATVPHP